MDQQTDSQLLRAYAENRSDAAFSELVRRHVDFVYSAARRMVCDPHLAEDVTQGVFVAFAKNARQLTDRSVFSGWLHRTAQNIAAQTVRTIERRRAREQEAVAMNELLAHESDAAWENIARHLDTALGELSEPDRDALLLRYFERKSAREMALTLGTSEEAAQKRVNRAVERLRELFSKRNVTVGASGLVVMISANAVQAAPVGLIVTISTAVSLVGTAIQTSTAIAVTKTIAMTTLQKTLITAAIAVATGAGIYEAHEASILRSQVQTLQQQQASLAELDQLRMEKERLAARLQANEDELENLRKGREELLRMRGQVGALRQEVADARQRLAEPGARTNDSAKTWVVGEIKPKGEWKDAGQGSPLAAVETFWWAAANNNIDRMKQCIVFDRKTNAEPVSELYAKREAQSNAARVQQIKDVGVRLLSHSSGLLDADRAKIDIAVTGSLPQADGSMSEIMDQQDFQLLKINGEWKVIRDPERLNLTIWDEDSDTLAKLMMQMDPKTLEQLKADRRLPLRTLRAYEELKSKAAK